MWDTVIAVAGTLLGGLLASVAKARADRTALSDARAQQRRDAQLAAAADLVQALERHRRTMWLREQHRLDGADPGVLDAARCASHETRDALSGPLTRVTLLAPSLAAEADAAAQAAYRLRGAPDERELDDLRERAVMASKRFVERAAALFGS